MTRFQVTRRDIDKALNRARSMTRSTSSGGKALPMAVRQGESAATAFGYGVLEGKHGPIKVGPFSGDLLGCLLLNLAAMTDMVGSAGDHFQNIAQGLGDSYAYKLGNGVGTAWAQRTAAQNAPPAPQVQQAPQPAATAAPVAAEPATTPPAVAAGYRRSLAAVRDLTRAEIATMADAARR